MGRNSGLQELPPLEDPVAPGVLQPVGRPLLPPPLLLGHGQGPALGSQPGAAASTHPGLLQAAEQQVRHRADSADGQLSAQVAEVRCHPPLGLLQALAPTLVLGLAVSHDLQQLIGIPTELRVRAGHQLHQRRVGPQLGLYRPDGAGDGPTVV